jgi:hypothetical protein
MSRYRIATNVKKFYAVVGYDDPLQTFWIHIIDNEAETYNNNVDWIKTPDAEEKQELIFSVGNRSKEVTDIASLEQYVSGIVEIPDDIKTKLQADKDNSKGPNNFQRHIINIIEGLTK